MDQSSFYPDYKNQTAVSKNAAPFLVFFIGILCFDLFQILYLPYINLLEGLGYDGMWYMEPSKVLFPKDVDHYHLFRILPSTLVYFLKKFFGFENTNPASVVMFQYLNLTVILGSLFFAEAISRFYSFGLRQKWFFYLLTYLNFFVWKESIFNPVMTDSVALFVAIGLFYFTITNRTVWFSLFCLITWFVLPILSLVFIGERILRRLDFSDIQYKPPFNISKWLAIGVITGFISLLCLVVLYLGHRSVFVLPDRLNMWLFPISAILLSITFYYVFTLFSDLFNRSLLAFKQLTKLLCWEMLLLVSLFTIQFILVSNIGHPPTSFAGHFIFGVPISVTLKPMIGLFENVANCGLVVLFFVIILPPLIQAKRISYQLLFITFVTAFFLLKPESRHTHIFMSAMGLIVVANFPAEKLTSSFLLSVFGFNFLFSKIWYPVHLAWFAPGYVLFSKGADESVFQEFPAQHYFMFQGLMISHTMYFLWLIPIAGAFWFVWKSVRTSTN